jgi:hypothetical protein
MLELCLVQSAWDGRAAMCRFKIDDVVEIKTVIFSKHTGRKGRITKVLPSRQQTPTLDRYVVRLSETEEETFWDIQLVLVSPPA